MSELGTGSVVTMKAMRVQFRNEKSKVTGYLDFKAPKGKVFTLILLGAEPANGSDPLDADKVLTALGWHFKED